VLRSETVWSVGMASSSSSSSSSTSSSKTRVGHLSPWEVAKAMAYHQVIDDMTEHLEKTAWQLLGVGKWEYIANHVQLEGGGHPSDRAVRARVQNVEADPSWQPGETISTTRGKRPAEISESQKNAIAKTAMSLKRANVPPSPETVRIKLPRVAWNKERDAPISDETIRTIFKERCYDEAEDDLWIYLPSPAQDALPEEAKPQRVRTAKYVLDNFSKAAAWNFIAIDPCFTILPKTKAKQTLLQINSMGKSKWMSEKSSRKGNNLRAPATAKTQSTGGSKVYWTPVFSRGRLKIFVCPDTDSALANADQLGEFVSSVLPGLVAEMKDEWDWSSQPRVILHDKASYFVSPQRNKLNPTFAEGLERGGFTSWVGDDASWLAGTLGDLYLHETINAHIRRLLATTFRRTTLSETVRQFKNRMAKVEEHMNYEMGEGESLLRLGKQLHERAEMMKDYKGERIPK
jgi:hypothetical protein